jgi:plastocyanin
MHTLRPVVALAAALVVAACTSAKPGWTYAPAPSATPAPSVEASGAAPSGSAAASASAPASAPASASASASGGGGGTVLEIEAENVAYKESTLTAPAGQPFKIDFKNNDAGTPHNVAIHKDSATGTEIFKGDIFPGVAEKTYDVQALDAGTYAFVCSVHPNMTGTLTVQ